MTDHLRTATRNDRPPAAAVSPDEQQRVRSALQQVRGEVAKAVVGQEQSTSALLIGLLTGGHVLLEGVPGVAKTLLIRTLAQVLDTTARRIQFTADMMPADITGSLVYNSQTSEFEFRPGPVFTNILLADEINRTPPKTQAALLEAMEERQVTTDGVSRPLPRPFLVAATQNPVEYEGTYPLPEAQLDRFLIKTVVELPRREDEIDVVSRHASGFDPGDLAAAGVRKVAGPAELEIAARAVRQVAIDPVLVAYLVDLARATRQAPSVLTGVSPRASTALLATARAWAWLSGRDFVTPDDIRALAPATWGHRITLRPEAQLDGAGALPVLHAALESVPVPR